MKSKALNTIFPILFSSFLLLLSPLLAMLIGLCLIYRRLINYCATSFKGYESRVKGPDLMYVYDDLYNKPSCNNLMLHILEEMPDLDRLSSDLETTYELRTKNGKRIYEKLAFYPEKWCGYWFWKKEAGFRVQNKIRVLPEVIIETEKDISRYVESWIRKGFQKNTSAWELYIVPVKFVQDSNPDKCIVFQVASHLIFDGQAIVKFVLKLGGVHVVPKESVTSRVKLPLKGQLLSLVKTLGFGPLRFYKEMKDFNSDRNVIKRIDFDNEELSGDWSCSFAPKIPISRIKMASRAFNCKFQELVFAAIVGGLRGFIRKYYGEKDIPDLVRAIMPIPWANHPNDSLVNHWLPFRLQLPTGISEISNRILKIREINKTAAEETALPIFAPFVYQLTETLPVAKYLSQLNDDQKGLTLLVSFIPEIAKVPDLFGIRVQETMYWSSVFHNKIAALIIGSMASNGSYRVTLTSDKSCIRTTEMLDDLADMIYLEFTEIFKLAEAIKAKNKIEPESLPK